jgi:hypothetical protein
MRVRQSVSRTSASELVPACTRDEVDENLAHHDCASIQRADLHITHTDDLPSYPEQRSVLGCLGAVFDASPLGQIMLLLRNHDAS